MLRMMMAFGLGVVAGIAVPGYGASWVLRRRRDVLVVAASSGTFTPAAFVVALVAACMALWPGGVVSERAVVRVLLLGLFGTGRMLLWRAVTATEAAYGTAVVAGVECAVGSTASGLAATLERPFATGVGVVTGVAVRQLVGWGGGWAADTAAVGLPMAVLLAVVPLIRRSEIFSAARSRYRNIYIARGRYRLLDLCDRWRSVRGLLLTAGVLLGLRWWQNHTPSGSSSAVFLLAQMDVRPPWPLACFGATWLAACGALAAGPSPGVRLGAEVLCGLSGAFARALVVRSLEGRDLRYGAVAYAVSTLFATLGM